MKRNRINRILLIFISVTALVLSFLSCEKDKLTEPAINIDSEITASDIKTDLIVQRIKRFENQIKEVKNGTYRGVEYLDADSALWNIESLFNTTYSFPDKNYVDKKMHELSFFIDVDDEMLSMKDVCLLSTLGIPAVAPNSETQFVSDKVLDEFRMRFKNIVLLYDSDLTGVRFMNKIRKQHRDLIVCMIPRKYEAKDISDFYQKYGKSKTIELIKESIKHIKHEKEIA